MAKRVKRSPNKNVDDRVRVACQLRRMIGADSTLFYEKIWLWPAPIAPLAPRRWKVRHDAEETEIGVYSVLFCFTHEHGYLWSSPGTLLHQNHAHTGLYKIINNSVYEPICVVCEQFIGGVGREVQAHRVCNICFDRIKDVLDFFTQ